MPLFARFREYWNQDRSLTALLVLLALNILVLSPAARLGSIIIASLAQWSLILLLAAGILAMGRGAYRITAFGFLLVAISLRLSLSVHDAPWLNVAASAFASGTHVFIIYGVASMVYAEGPVTRPRILGGVALYLLIAAFFSSLYALVERAQPGAFQSPSGGRLDPAQLADTLGYFSCVTLTTVGFGDVTAVHPLARSLVMFEALIGQLYPAILLARLVTLYEGTLAIRRKGGRKDPAQG